MRRRDIVAGIGSMGVLAGAGGLLWQDLPSFTTDEPGSADDEDDGDPLEVETVDAPGSEAGTITIPDERVTTVMFFATSCGHCKSQVPRLADARERLDAEYGDSVRVLGAALDSADILSADELRDWWSTHGGNGAVGYSAGLSNAYGVLGYPTTIVVGTDGEKQWSETDVLSAREIVRAVEGVLEDEGIDGEPADTDATSDETTADGPDDDAAQNETTA